MLFVMIKVLTIISAAAGFYSIKSKVAGTSFLVIQRLRRAPILRFRQNTFALHMIVSLPNESVEGKAA